MHNPTLMELLRPNTRARALKETSLWFLCAGLIAFFLADIEITTRDPWLELGRIGSGLIQPDFSATERLFEALGQTIAFALLGVAIGAVLGFLLAQIYHWRAVQWLCALTRAVHELFWALIFLQLFGLGPVTGLLAICLPYAATFARIYAELLEGADRTPLQTLPAGCSRLSGFLYCLLPQAWPHMRSYTVYRFECGLRTSTILGFIGLPTIGFHLETAFKQGQYGEAAALLYLFFVLIALIPIWLRPRLIPVYVIAAIWLLPDSTGLFNWDLFVRFVTYDIVPSPLRSGEWLSLDTWSRFGDWFARLFFKQGLPGIWSTLILGLVSLILSALSCLALFPLISQHFVGRAGGVIGHWLLVVARSTPEMMLAFVGLLVFGPSMLPAILALGFHNGALVANLIGRYSSGLSLRIDAPHGMALYLYEILPRAFPQMLAFLLYRWEVIMRESAILGMLGITTLGFYVDSAFENFYFDRAMMLILITALLNLMVDRISRYVRDHLGLGSPSMQE